MPSFTGRYRCFDAGGKAIGEGSCQLAIEGEHFRLIPFSGSPLACDLGDIDSYVAGDYEISLKLYTGNTVLLTHFAQSFQNLCSTLLEAYRARLVQCLLLEDLEEVERFGGWAQLDSVEASFSSRVEIRMYRSNFAILPETATGFSWRYADIDAVDLDESSYTLAIRSGGNRLILTRLAKRTRELAQRLQGGMAAVSDIGAQVIHSSFPFLTPDQFTRVAAVFKEGRAVSVRDLNAVDPQMESALFRASVDSSMKDYLEFLNSLSVDGGCFAGFKEIRGKTAEARENGEAVPEPAETSGEPDSAANGKPDGATILHWFFFILKSSADPAVPGNIAAWEATSATGRATYFFRLLPQGEESVLKDAAKAQAAIASAVLRLNRAIVMLNFRREPIYLPDESLQMQESYRRYAIACRKIPVLRQLRASFLGRALHSTPAGWRKQVQTLLEKAL